MLPSPSSPTPSRANARMGARTTPRGTLGTAGAARFERLRRFPGPPNSSHRSAGVHAPRLRTPRRYAEPGASQPPLLAPLHNQLGHDPGSALERPVHGASPRYVQQALPLALVQFSPRHDAEPDQPHLGIVVRRPILKIPRPNSFVGGIYLNVPQRPLFAARVQLQRHAGARCQRSQQKLVRSGAKSLSNLRRLVRDDAVTGVRRYQLANVRQALQLYGVQGSSRWGFPPTIVAVPPRPTQCCPAHPGPIP